MKQLPSELLLENRALYENVHSQVNNRFKAIKDTLSDSSSRLLSRAPLNVHDFRPNASLKTLRAEVHRRLHDDRPGNVNDKPAMNGDGYEDEHADNGRPSGPNATQHPVLSEAMSELSGDVVVVPGYRGSVLRSAEPPHRQLWVPVKVGLNLRKVDLKVGLEHEDEQRIEESIIASGPLEHLGPVDLCRRLLRRLRKCENARNGSLRVWAYGYDWRLSPHMLSQNLIRFVEGLSCNNVSAGTEPNGSKKKCRGAYVIAHSLGGLITRHAVNQRPELFAGVVFAGTPQCCVNILGPLRSGDDVLLSSRVLTAQANFTFRTSFLLLPEDGQCFIDRKTSEPYLIDFFSVDDWHEYCLSPCINLPLPIPEADRRRGFRARLPNSPIVGKRISAVLGGKLDAPQSGGGKEYSRQTSGRGGSTSRTQGLPHRQTDPSVLNPSMEHAASSELLTANTRVQWFETSTTASQTSRSTGAHTDSGISTSETQKYRRYLERTLNEIKQFKDEMAFNPEHEAENRYPPFAVLYGQSVPTVYGARVSSREQIKRQDAFDDLAFAAGDGVCLASAAMIPQGYRLIKDGLVRSERGHLGLLGDMDGVGQCLRVLIRGRREGVGLGNKENGGGYE